jgi:hypothetical protein
MPMTGCPQSPLRVGNTTTGVNGLVGAVLFTRSRVNSGWVVAPLASLTAEMLSQVG